jgi:hypothetical protein
MHKPIAAQSPHCLLLQPRTHTTMLPPLLLLLLL